MRVSNPRILPAMSRELPFERGTRQVFVRKDAETSPKFGSDPSKKSTEHLLDYGIVNIDKPRGPTSHQVSAYVKEIFGLSKAGHSGTLDPHVTGCLPIALGKGTRIVQTLLTAGKEYVCLMHIHKEVSEQEVIGACKAFVGKIKQLPPIKSAVKRQERFRKIYYLDVLDIIGQDVLFVVGCQAGTYIRKLVHDIGQKLGCGAHMAQLVRTKAGPFKTENIVQMYDLVDAFHKYKETADDTELRKLILPIEAAVDHLPKVWVIDTTVNTVCHGSDLKVPGIAKVESDIQVGEDVAIMTLKGELVGLGEAKMISKEMQKKEKGIAVKTKKVFLPSGIYPKIDKE